MKISNFLRIFVAFNIIILSFSYRVQSNFDVSNYLLPNESIWYTRLFKQIEYPNHNPNVTHYAYTGDLYTYGRSLAYYMVSLIHVLKFLPDPEILEEIDRLAEIMRAQLEDWSKFDLSELGYCCFKKDGYLNWQWKYNHEGYQGSDWHHMDGILSHTLVAQFSYIFMMNRDYHSKYNERYNFWVDYLTNHFEAKWRNRTDSWDMTKYPVFDKGLAHPHIAWTRWHFYMYKLTGISYYLDEVKRRTRLLKNNMKKVTTDAGTIAYTWDHNVNMSASYTPMCCQHTVYARGTILSIVDIYLNKMDTSMVNDEFMQYIVNTVKDILFRYGEQESIPQYDFYPGCSCGDLDDQIILPGCGYDDEDWARIWVQAPGVLETMAFDDSGEIQRIVNTVFELKDNEDRPKYYPTPVAMLVSIMWNKESNENSNGINAVGVALSATFVVLCSSGCFFVIFVTICILAFFPFVPVYRKARSASMNLGKKIKENRVEKVEMNENPKIVDSSTHQQKTVVEEKDEK